MESLNKKISELRRENKNLNKEVNHLKKEMNKRLNKMNKDMEKMNKNMNKSVNKRRNMRGGAETEGATFMAAEFYEKTAPSTNAQTVTSGDGAVPPAIDNTDKVVNVFQSEPASVMPSNADSYPMAPLEMKMAPGQTEFTMSGGMKKNNKRNNKKN